MFYQLLFIHLYRPFLKYTKSTSPLPPHVSPRKLCIQAASAISKLLRIYKRIYGFNQIVNIVVYIAHTACTIHLLNLPEKNAQRDIIHGLKNLEEMGESWLCARRTLRILDISANKWQVNLPDEAVAILERTHAKWGSWGSWDQASTSSPSTSGESPTMLMTQFSTTVPSAYSSPGRHVHRTVPPDDPQMQVPVTFVEPMASYYPPAPSIPASQPPIPTTQRSLSAQLQRPQFALPEPTYLRPMPHISYPLQAVQLPQQDAWYNHNTTQENQVPTGLNARQETPPTTGTSPMTVFDESGNNLVEESRNWWTRDQNALRLGVDNWGEGWNRGSSGGAGSDGGGGGGIPIPAATFDLPYQNNNLANMGVGQTSGRMDSSQASPPPGLTAGVLPTSAAEPDANSDGMGYNDMENFL